MANKTSKSKTSAFALMGAETLLGREISSLLASRMAATSVIPFSVTGESTLGEQDGEAVYVEELTATTIQDKKALILAGASEGSAKAYDLVKAARKKPVLIDCTGHLDSRPEARMVAPLVDCDGEVADGWLWTLCNPAATAIALTLQRLGRLRHVQRAVVEIFEPASERGKSGLTELQQQTTGLLTFKPLKKDVFDTQLSFAMLAQYGEDAPEALSTVEQRIEKHVATLLSRSPGGGFPMPSLRLIQAPVFHGYSISLWVEFAAEIGAAELRGALASAQIEVREPDQEVPTNVDAANQDGLIAGDIRVDRNNGRAAWIWLVGDNLRLRAEGVVELVKRDER